MSIKLWSTGVKLKDYTERAKAGEMTMKEATDAYLGAVWDKNKDAIQNGRDGFGLDRQQFINNVRENAIAEGVGVKRRIKTTQFSRSYMSAEEMGKVNAEKTLRGLGDWRPLRQKLGRGNYEVERVGDKKDKTYRYKGSKGSFVIRFHEEYQVAKHGELYDIGIDDTDGGIDWSEDDLPW